MGLRLSLCAPLEGQGCLGCSRAWPKPRFLERSCVLQPLPRAGRALGEAGLEGHSPRTLSVSDVFNPLLSFPRQDARSAAATFGPRANTVLERVEGAQQRWKLQVQEQRLQVSE